VIIQMLTPVCRTGNPPIEVDSAFVVTYFAIVALADKALKRAIIRSMPSNDSRHKTDMVSP
jgi:hypothetical protein